MSFDVPVNGRLRDISGSKVCPVNPLRVSENLRLTDRNISDSCKKLETNKRLTSFFQSCWRATFGCKTCLYNRQDSGTESWTSVSLLWRHPFKLRSEIFNQLWNKNTSLLLHLPFTKFQLVPKGPHAVMVFDFLPSFPCMLMHKFQLHLPIRFILVVKRLGPGREAKCFWPLLCPAVIIA